MTIIQKIKHKLAVHEAAKRRKLARIAEAVNTGFEAAEPQKHHATGLRMMCIRFGEMVSHFGYN